MSHFEPFGWLAGSGVWAGRDDRSLFLSHSWGFGPVGLVVGMAAAASLLNGMDGLPRWYGWPTGRRKGQMSVKLRVGFDPPLPLPSQGRGLPPVRSNGSRASPRTDGASADHERIRNVVLTTNGRAFGPRTDSDHEREPWFCGPLTGALPTPLDSGSEAGMTVPQYPTRWGVPWLGEWVWTRRIGRNQYTMEGVALRFLVCARNDGGLRSG